MNLKIYNNIESFSNDNISRSSLVNCKKRISIIKTQTLNEHGYREMMQKKKEIKNSLLSSHNNYINNNNLNDNNNLLNTNENENNNQNNFPINSSINISSNFLNINSRYLNNNKNSNLSNEKSLSRESSEEVSEMSFGMVCKKKEKYKKKINEENNNNDYSLALQSKRVKNKNNYITSSSVDNKINYIKKVKNNNLEIILKKLDKKNSKDFITPVKGKLSNENSNSQNKRKNMIKKIVINPKLKNQNNIINHKFNKMNENFIKNSYIIL